MHENYETAFKCKVVDFKNKGKLYAVWFGKIYKFKHYKHRDKFINYTNDIIMRRVAWHEHLHKFKSIIY